MKDLHKPRSLTLLLPCLVIALTACSSSVEREWNQEEGYRWAALNPSGEEVGFEMLDPSSTGISFTNSLSEEHIAENQNLLNGSGVAAGDIDGDGWVDLYFTALDGTNKLYKNIGGLSFKDITDQAGVRHENYNSTGAVFADVDGDENLDLLISSMSKANALYLNDGNGNFTLKKDSGLQQGKGSMTMALSDIDGDGDLDLYQTNYKERQAKDIFDLKELSLENMTRRSGDTFEIRPPYDRHFALLQDENGYNQRELGERDELYINQGDGTFNLVEDPENRFFDTEGQPLGLNLDWGLTAKFGDLNGDGLQDLYVCNDYWTPDRVWMNQGDGTFQAIDDLAIRNFSFYSMAVDFSDVNRDGALDFFVTEMLAESHRDRMRQLVPNDPMYSGRTEDQPQFNRNSFYLNRKDTTFAELTYFAGLERSGWSWAAKFLDVDLDGYEDLIVNNGFSYDMQDLDAQNRLSQEVARSTEAMKDYVLQFPRLELRNKAYRNTGKLKFVDKSNEWGFRQSDISHGLATADFDHDGDLDLAVNRLNEEAAIYENSSGAGRIAVRLIGKQPNTQAIGAKILLTGEEMQQSKEISSGGDYLSGSDPLAVFAASNPDTSYTLTISWPSGEKSTIDGLRPNRIYEIEQMAIATRDSSSVASASSKVFQDVSNRIQHQHNESDFDESQLQDLLPIGLSKLGPGISWIDYDRDGDEDLFIGAAKGDKTGIFENIGNGRFQSTSIQGFSGKASGDQTAIIGWASGNEKHLLAGVSNYEQGSFTVPSGFHLTSILSDASEKQELPGIPSASGPIAVADYDGDQDIDLFVGGRFVPANYPSNATSRLFINENGQFKEDKNNVELLRDIGMVTGAVFTDYDGDGDQDLLLSRAWDTLMLLENENGTFSDVTAKVSLDRNKGWWNGVTSGDFNEDGRPDIIATNWGLNSAYQLDSSYPLKMFYGDFDRDNRQEIMEAYYDKASNSYVPRRSLNQLAGPIPPVTRFIQTFEQFANASLEEIFRTDLSNIPSKELNTLHAMVFINTEDGFRGKALPDEAQFAPSIDAAVLDYDNDGNEDLFLSQNLFNVPALFPRQDAGRGLLLEGMGDGSFEALSGNESGVKIYGQQRGAAVADFNNDGKTDLAVTQNDGATRLFANQTARSGLRIRLVGSQGNSNAIGSSIRLIYDSGSKGPRREIQAGSGYWSQNGFIQVLGYYRGKQPRSLEVTWPDGSIQEVELADGKRDYTIKYSVE